MTNISDKVIAQQSFNKDAINIIYKSTRHGVTIATVDTCVTLKLINLSWKPITWYYISDINVDCLHDTTSQI